MVVVGFLSLAKERILAIIPLNQTIKDRGGKKKPQKGAGDEMLIWTARFLRAQGTERASFRSP